MSNSSYFKNNRIRTKLLLFIDNEIQYKLKQNIQNLKLNCRNDNQINLEETFTQKRINKHFFSFSNIDKIKKNENSNKSLSTVDDSPNKIKEKSNKKRYIIHFKTYAKEDNYSNKLINISFDKKIYSIKNLFKQSSTFLILQKQKNSFEYLKILCNNFKICKNNKKTVKRIRSINLKKSKLLDFNKKINKKSNEIKLKKYKKENKYSLFRKSQKKNNESNSKNISRNLILIKIKQN